MIAVRLTDHRFGSASGPPDRNRRFRLRMDALLVDIADQKGLPRGADPLRRTLVGDRSRDLQTINVHRQLRNAIRRLT
jgi:hypothetical protein